MISLKLALIFVIELYMPVICLIGVFQITKVTFGRVIRGAKVNKSAEKKPKKKTTADTTLDLKVVLFRKCGGKSRIKVKKGQ